MCGVTGFVDPSAQLALDQAHAVLSRMTAALTHRGPDDGGEWLDGDARIALGNRRLAIIDVSSDGHQPMQSASERYVITFNGEIYNFRDLRRDLEGRGHVFRGHSDTEVALAAVEAWGLFDALERFNGMFAFALWDRAERTLHLGRDRLGEKPLYYGWIGKQFAFASELKALSVLPAFSGKIDRGALSLFLRYKYVPTPWSIYEGISKLPPGTVLSMGRSTIGSTATPQPYWSLRDAAERGMAEPLLASSEELTDELEALLRDAVRLRMESDVPLGALLSGGVDSSTVVALMQAQANEPIRTFTIGHSDHRFDEAGYARAVAKHLGTDHTELKVTAREAESVIPQLPHIYDEPFSDSSQIPTYLVSQLAREAVTVALSGDGGDEFFGGYNRYVWVPRIWRAIRWMPAPLRGLASRGVARNWRGSGPSAGGNGHGASGGGRPPSPDDHRRKLAEILRAEGPADMYLRLISHWKDPEALVPGAVEPRTLASQPGLWPGLPDPAQRMMWVDGSTYLPDDILTKLDRASMAVSLEARVPLLDHRVVEFAWRLPLTQKIRGGEGKVLLRRVLGRYVPKQLVDRPKMGFGLPIGAWLRGSLRDWAETLLDSNHLREQGLLDPGPVRALWSDHLSGRRDWHYHLWDVLMFESWMNAQGQSRNERLSPVHATESDR